MPGFLCALCCELYLLQSVGHFTGWERSSSKPKCLHQFKELQSRKFPAGLGPTLAAAAPSDSHMVINKGFKDRPQLWNSCRKFSLLSEASQWHTSLWTDLHHKLQSWDCYKMTVMPPGYNQTLALLRTHLGARNGLLEHSVMFSFQRLIYFIWSNTVHLLFMAQTDMYN